MRGESMDIGSSDVFVVKVFAFTYHQEVTYQLAHCTLMNIIVLAVRLRSI